jgi:hypothetical protein
MKKNRSGKDLSWYISIATVIILVFAQWRGCVQYEETSKLNRDQNDSNNIHNDRQLISSKRNDSVSEARNDSQINILRENLKATTGYYEKEIEIANKNLQATKEMFVKLNNPQIHVLEVSLGPDSTHKDHVGIRAIIKNFGNSPATEVILDGVRSHDSLQAMSEKIAVLERTSVIPQGSYLDTFLELDKWLYYFIKKKNAYFIRFEVHYKGIDGRQRATYCFYKYLPDQDQFTLITSKYVN